MKYIVVFLTLIASISFANSQEEQNYLDNVQSLDSTIKSLYSIISDNKDLERNWDYFKFLFKDDAEIILNMKNKEGVITKYYLSVDDYIKSYGNWLVKNGFYAKETERSISTFRHMHSVSSSYEYNIPSGKQGISEVNYINLLNENNRWYISNLKWNQEMDDSNSILKYMPNSKD